MSNPTTNPTTNPTIPSTTPPASASAAPETSPPAPATPAPVASGPADTQQMTAPPRAHLGLDPSSLWNMVFKAHNKKYAPNQAPRYYFLDFLEDLEMTSFDDPDQVRSILDIQAHILAALFSYHARFGNLDDMPQLFKAQKVMADTIKMRKLYAASAPDRTEKTGQIGGSEGAGGTAS